MSWGSMTSPPRGGGTVRVDPGLAQIVVALITVTGVVLTVRATRSAKRVEAAQAIAAAELARRDADWRYLEAARDAAIEDLTLERAMRRAAENHLALCIAALRLAGVTVPDAPDVRPH